MSTYTQLQSKIADDLNRTDLTSQIQREILRAIRKYASEPFWFSGKRFNFQAAIGQQYYDSADGLPSDIRIIDYVSVNQSVTTVNTDTGAADAYAFSTSPTTTSYSNGDIHYFKAANANTQASTVDIDSVGTVDITRPNGVALQVGDILANQIVGIVYDSSSGDFFLRDGTNSNYYELLEREIDQVIKRNFNNDTGLPLEYAWFANKIYLYPIPDQDYVIDIYYQQYYTDLSSGTDTNNFSTNYETEALIEQEAEMNLYRDLILDEAQASKCEKSRNDALKRCRRISAQLLGRHGKIRATQF